MIDGTVLLESKQDSFGRYLGGVEKDGTFHPTGRLYAPVRDKKGEIKAFQEVKPVTAREQEAAFLAGEDDAIAIYQEKVTPPPEGKVPMEQLQKSGESPLAGNYDLIHVEQISPGLDPYMILDAYRGATALRPGDLIVFKQTGIVTCWCVIEPGFPKLQFSKLPGLFGNFTDKALKSSVLKNLRQCQREAGKPPNGTEPHTPRHDPER